jgi:hypothetical protein
MSVTIAGVTYTNIGSTFTALASASSDSYAFGNITIPSQVNIPSVGDCTVVGFGSYAFQNCTLLSGISLPSTINTIGQLAFKATGLTSISIPNSVTFIGAGAFRESSALTSIHISKSLTNLLFLTFYACPVLTSVTFDNDSLLNTIGNSAFQYCNSLPSISIPSGVTSMGSAVFENCTALAKVAFLQVGGNFNYITGTIISGSGSRVAYIYSTTGGQSTLTSTAGFTSISYLSDSGTVSPSTLPSWYSNTLTYTSTSTPTIDWISGTTYQLTKSNGDVLSTFTPTGSPTATYTFNNVSIVPTGVITLNIPFVAYGFQVTVEAVCFKEDAKILTDKGYVPVQDLRKGSLVKTALNGYVPVDMIGKRLMNHVASNERIKEQLYKCGMDEYPEVFEDLVVTGCHSILVDKFVSEEEKQKAVEVNGDLYVTDKKYRLPACVDERAKVYETAGTYTIYHFALENNDYYMNYGVYANGLLVETSSKRYLKELSNMELIE